MAERFSCAVAARELGEPVHATASQVRRWLLVEQPGPWGADAPAHSGLPAEVAAGLRRRARAAGARLLLIRRHGRSAPQRRTCYAAVSTADVRRVERFRVDDPAELLDIDWQPLRRLAPVGGEALTDPVYLVCTNGAHDTCCAEFGRPIARILDAALPGQVWESSHFGGDRFAANLVCLPDGIYYGRVEAADALRLVERHRDRELDLRHYRGRSCAPFPAQAAEHFVRQAHGLTGIDDVLPQKVAVVPDGLFRVTVEVAGGQTLIATVECAPAAHPQRLTCKSVSDEHPPRYRLVALE